MATKQSATIITSKTSPYAGSQLERRHWHFILVTVNIIELAGVGVLALLSLVGWVWDVPGHEAFFVIYSAIFGWLIWLLRRATSKIELKSTATDDTIWAKVVHTLKNLWRTPDNRQRLIDNVKFAWIEGVLEKALVDDKLLILIGKADPQAVQQPRIARVLHRPNVPEYWLSSSEEIEKIYQELGHELLILGEPGSGKTITLLELARSLIVEAERDPTSPIPVVFNLTSWAEKRRPLVQWLEERLRLDYSVPKKLARTWLADGRLIFLLDGLDEVQRTVHDAEGQEVTSLTDYRNECVQAINVFWQEYNFGNNGIVICSRTEEYQVLSHKLQFENANTAILLQPLTLEQARSYIRHLGNAWDGLQQAFETDAILQQLATSPLLLNIMAVAYQDMPAGQITSFQNTEDQTNHLFHHYTHACLHRTIEKESLPQKQVRHYLSWLARKMIKHGQTIFYIEDLSTTWLETQTKRLYLLGITLINGLLLGLLMGLLFGLPYGLIVGLLLAAINGVFLKHNKIDFVEVIKLEKNMLIYGLIVGLLGGLLLGLLGGLPYGLLGGLPYGLLVGLLLGVIFGTILGQNEIKLKTVPNQAVWLSTRNAIILGLLGGLFVGLLSGLLSGLFVGMTVGLLNGLLYGLLTGGLAVIAHIILRLILFQNQSIPFNYAHFLDDAAGHHLLRKVGGGYIFRHRMLMEYFAGQREM